MRLDLIKLIVLKYSLCDNLILSILLINKPGCVVFVYHADFFSPYFCSDRDQQDFKRF